MSVFYRLAYQLGFTPWERMARLPVAEQVAAKFAREESGRQPPYGQALDLGCGRGVWSIRLAARGWQVTGVEIVPKAVRAARKRAKEADVDVRFVQSDVTSLRSASVGTGFQLLLDFGCFHNLTDAQRQAIGREVSAVAAAGATLLMLAWMPGRTWGPLSQRGATRGEIEAAYPGWKVTDEEACDVSGAPGIVRRAEPRWYRLRHD